MFQLYSAAVGYIVQYTSFSIIRSGQPCTYEPQDGNVPLCQGEKPLCFKKPPCSWLQEQVFGSTTSRENPAAPVGSVGSIVSSVTDHRMHKK